MALKEDNEIRDDYRTIYKVLPLISLRNYCRIMYPNLTCCAESNNITYTHLDHMINHGGYKVQDDILYRPIRKLAATARDLDYLMTMHPLYPELPEFNYPKPPKKKSGRPKGSKSSIGSKRPGPKPKKAAKAS